MMGMLLHFLFVLLGVLNSVLLVQAQDQSGFISLDCGLPADGSYTERSTGINYISDVKFIDAGVSKSVLPEYQTNHQQQLVHLRSFPSGVRNCYRINVTTGTKYLIRASFLYGNYDNQDQFPQFDLYIGANLWDTVKVTNASLSLNSEVIHTPSLNYIHLCLVNNGTGTPFISAIELRTLPNNTYDTQSSVSLARLRRFDFGSITDLTYRYKDDVYDRIWVPISFNMWTQLSSPLSPDNLTQNDYKPPAVVMSTAATSVNVSAPFEFYWDPDNVNEQYYIYMHFNEVENLAANETRAFNITMNGKFFYGPVVPVYQSTSTVFSSSALTGARRYIFSLFKAEKSSLPPIINAAEIYTVKDFSQSETEQDDVDAITNIKQAYGMTRNWEGDPCAPVKFMWEGLNCSFDGNNPPRITALTLSSSRLTGQIPSYISKLTMLQYLDLSNNSLNGPVPDFLTQLQSLKVLNLENNNLTGVVPSGLVDRSKEGSLSLSMGKNPNLCESAPCNQVNQQTEGKTKKKRNNIVVPIVASVAGLLVLLLIAAAAIVYGLKKGKPQAVNNHAGPKNSNGSPFGSKQRQYSHNELVNITNNFDENRILGRGGFGTVYLGFIDDIQVAVKRLSPSAVQGYQQFVAEVKLLLIVHHRNLTSLIGYCNEETSIGLIYEYMANGNLYEHLSGKSKRAKFLTWEDRLRIAVDAAQGLEYLHNGCKPPIIHRDVKSTNILLNENFQAKLADFGLSRSFPTDGGTHVSTAFAGTPGYLDPEYIATKKTDVYSFGVVILEIVTGEPAITRTSETEKTHISQWVSSMVSNGDIENVVDSRLQGEFDTSSVWKAVEIAMACLSTYSDKRPDMSDVVTVLKECLAAELARTRPGRDTETKDTIELVTTNLTTEITPLAR